MQSITANELKVKGVPLLDETVGQDGEAVITVRGQARYVVLPVSAYDRLRELELVAALSEVREDLAAGRFHDDTVAEHLQRIQS